jgi:DNA helicase-2/ATP-dependent DNA helicase PcrA
MYGRTMPAQPSLFLREIDSNCLKTDDRISKRAVAGKSFNPYSFNKSATTKTNEVEERAGWRRGQRLFHENYGYGAVMEVTDSDDSPIVRVRFDNGKETRFLSEYQGRAFEKMGNDC